MKNIDQNKWILENILNLSDKDLRKLIEIFFESVFPTKKVENLEIGESIYSAILLDFGIVHFGNFYLFLFTYPFDISVIEEELTKGDIKVMIKNPNITDDVKLWLEMQ